MSRLEPGARIGDWVIGSLLGEGGMGAVYACESSVSSRIRAAVKVLKPHGLSDARIRFLREMEVAATLDHPAIVRVLGVGEHEDVLFMAMELLDGETFEALIAAGPTPPDRALALIAPVVDALAHAHQRGVRHRDIKPANIMRCADGSVKVLDFGIAVQEDRTRLTQGNALPGTLAYIAPEAFAGRQPDPASSDVYATGLVLHELLTGASAFAEADGVSAGQRMARIMAAKLQSGASDPGSEHDLAVRQLVAWATASQPEQRLPSMTLFAEGIQRAAEGDADGLPPLTSGGGQMLAPALGGLTADSVSTLCFDLDDVASDEDAEPEEDDALDVARRRGPWLGLLMVAAVAAGGILLTDSTPPPIAETPAPPKRPTERFDYQLVEVLPGDFLMGSNDLDPWRRADERQHVVQIRRPFAIGTTEVSQGLWEHVTGDNPAASRAYPPDYRRFESLARSGGDLDLPPLADCSDSRVGPDLPVICVTWHDALAFANRLSQMEELTPAYAADGTWDPDADGYRLPTEAEWEYAARAGAQHRFSGTDDPEAVCEFGNVATRATKRRHHARITWKPFECEEDAELLAPVTSSAPNGRGLHQMSGNAAEWVFDAYGDYPDGADPVRLVGGTRVLRGGDWSSGPKQARVSARGKAASDRVLPTAGLRLARTLPAP